MAKTLSPRAAFRRRLAILLGAFVVAGAAMAAQMVRLGVAGHAESLSEAENRLYRERWIPTVRGRVIDRHGRVLAQNRPSYEVAVEYPVLSGAWAREHATRHARRKNAQAWSLMSGAQREAEIGASIPLYEEHVGAMEERLARLLGVETDELRERRAEVVSRVERLSETITARRLERYITEQEERGVAVTPSMRASLEDRAAQPLAEEEEPHVLGVVSDQTAFQIQRLAELETLIHDGFDGDSESAPSESESVPVFPGLVVRRTEDREYPFDRMSVTLARSSLPGPLRDEEPVSIDVDGVAIHLLGWMDPRAVAEDVERRALLLESDEGARSRALIDTLAGERDRGRYMPGDAAGRSGIELSQEAALRGLRGIRIDRLDTGEQRHERPEPGRDVHLTLDIALQARVQALMQPEFGLARVQPWQGENPVLPVGAPLNGAAVVLEVDSGDILAMVSTPGFDREVTRGDRDEFFADRVNQPWLNRAIGVPYPPGSILKALILPAAVTHGHATLEERIACDGHLLPGQPDRLRCWIYRPVYGMATHSAQFDGDLDAVDALTVSCNIYFYNMGRRLGARAIADTLKAFGLRTEWDLGVGYEFSGRIGGGIKVGEDQYRYPNDGSNLSSFDATLMGIGQGPVAWTPLHAAAAYATLGRMGVSVAPRLVRDGSAPVTRELPFDRRAIDASLRGLDGVVNNADHGTAYSINLETGREPVFNAPGVRVLGKTGTATAPPYDPDGREGPIEAFDEVVDHAWVTILVGPEGGRPRYAISVIMEYGGSGGRVSGPIANQIVHALLTEGYL